MFKTIVFASALLASAMACPSSLGLPLGGLGGLNLPLGAQTIADNCRCTKTIVRPQLSQRILNVPSCRRVVQNTIVPALDTINYNTQRVPSVDGSLGLGCNGGFIGGLGYNGPLVGGLGYNGPIVGGCGCNGPIVGGLGYNGPIVGGLGYNGPIVGGCGCNGPLVGGLDYNGPLVGGFGGAIVNDGYPLGLGLGGSRSLVGDVLVNNAGLLV